MATSRKTPSFMPPRRSQSHIEGRIRIVEDKLARAQVIETGGSPPDTVRFGVTVLLSPTTTPEKKVRYTIIGEDESDVAAGRLISVTSPVARALLGKSVGDEVTVRVPKGSRSFEVLDIRISNRSSRATLSRELLVEVTMTN